MAIYAAQIDAMDQGFGKILNKLKELGEFDNTIIMFCQIMVHAPSLLVAVPVKK